jgi:peroxiredoxin
MNKFIILFSLLLVSGIVQASMSLADLPIVPVDERQDAPVFITENFHGGTAGLADYKGKVVLLHFWATWCLPCREEMLGMEKLWQKYKDQGLIVVTISHATDSKADVETYLKALDLSFPILLDQEGEANGQYKVSRVPTSFLIDGNGKVISRVAGMREWESPEGVQLVEKLLSENF